MRPDLMLTKTRLEWLESPQKHFLDFRLGCEAAYQGKHCNGLEFSQNPKPCWTRIHTATILTITTVNGGLSMLRLTIFIWLSIPLAFMMGCSDEPFVLEQMDAQVGQGGYSGGNTPGQGATQGTGATTGTGNEPGYGGNPGSGASQGTCVPGMRLGTCSVCGPNGQPSIPPEETACTIPDCGGYEKVEEGDDVVCYQKRPAGSVCSALGQCATAEEYCANVQRIEAERMPLDPCRELSGCVGNTPPSIQQRGSLGSPCNGAGVCQERPDTLVAECSVQIPGLCNFDGIDAVKFFCPNDGSGEAGYGESGGRNYCTYFVAPPNNGRTRCVDFCESLNMDICDQSREQCCWNNAEQSTCLSVSAVPCEMNPCDDPNGCTDQICRCFERDPMP